MSESQNQIVIYQPDETLRIDIRLENDTVWLTQAQMAALFGCTGRNVRLHLENIYDCGELEPEATRKDFFLVRRPTAPRRPARAAPSAPPPPRPVALSIPVVSCLPFFPRKISRHFPHFPP